MGRSNRRVARLREHVLKQEAKKSEVTEEAESRDEEDIKALTYEKNTKAEIGQILTDKGIEFNTSLTKGELIELLLRSE